MAKLEDGTFWAIAMAMNEIYNICTLLIAILGWADRYRTTSNGPADCSVMNGNVNSNGLPLTRNRVLCNRIKSRSFLTAYPRSAGTPL